MTRFEPVFPRPYSNDTSGDFTVGEPAQTGMDLRTYIATQAMAGLLAGGALLGDGHLVAGAAVELADELIAALNK